MQRQLASAAVHAGTDAELSAESNGAAVMVALFASEVRASDRLLPLPEELALYQDLSQGVLAVVQSLLRDAKFFFSHAMRPVHCWGEPCLRRRRKMDVKQLRMADT